MEENKKINIFNEEDIYRKATQRVFKALSDGRYQYDYHSYYIPKNNNVKFHVNQKSSRNDFLTLYTLHPSIVEFYIDELPGWRFGIWWKEEVTEIPLKALRKDEEDSKVYILKGTLFTQYEENINKFKPSESELKVELDLRGDSLNEINRICDKSLLFDLLNFMFREPYLAFYRDYNSADLNSEYVTRKEAKKCFIKALKYWKKEKKVIDKANKIITKFYNETIKPLFKGLIITDAGENWSPRYHLLLPIENNEFDITKPGSYWLGDLYEDLIDELDKVENRCAKIADPHMWFNPYSRYINFYVEGDKDANIN